MMLRYEKQDYAINILFGLVGAFNFGNILFYLKAHQAFADNPRLFSQQ
jgi:hypothetical protein